MTTVFLFAHQDDEMGVFHEISATLARKEEVVCLYLTNGIFGKARTKSKTGTSQRSVESKKVLSLLGVPERNIIFLGDRLEIGDGTLVENLARCRAALIPELEKQGTPDRIVMHSWEGGHQDHDAVHLLGLSLALYFGLLEHCYQFPLYRMPAGRFFLSFAAPLKANGPVLQTDIPWRARMRYLALLRHYRSQKRVMIKLGLHMVWNFLFDGRQNLQPVSLKRIYERPNTGMMLYEYWKLYREEKFRKKATPFINDFL